MRFVIRDPKKGRSGSLRTVPPCSGPGTQHTASPSAAYGPICCVFSLRRDPARTTGKGHFVYSACVVHFRKLLNNVKVGSPENRHPVI